MENIKDLSEKLNVYFENFYNNFEKTYIDDAVNFLSHNRIDVLIKILYCEYFLGISPTKINRTLYYFHLKKLNERGFKANDSFKKNFKDYENEFKKTINSISERGFDINKSIIPIDKQNKIIDGSHRLATLIVLEKKVTVAKFLEDSPNISLLTMIKRLHIKNDLTQLFIIDYIIQTYIKYDKNLRIITLFPVRNKIFDKDCMSIIKKYGEIIIQKKIPAYSQTNAFNICRTFYLGAKWIGNHTNSWGGAKWKSDACFNNSDGVIDVLLFKPNKIEYSSKEFLKKIKDDIRSIYKIHFHSIHSSDNNVETLSYSKIFFHSTSLQILKKRQTKFFLKLEIFLEELNTLKLNASDFVFSGSSVLAALGFRAPKDIDLFHTDSFKLPGETNSHNNQIGYIKTSINEVIFNPKNYFYYMNYKFLHPRLLLELKTGRNAIKPNNKDREDIKFLKKFIQLL